MLRGASLLFLVALTLASLAWPMVARAADPEPITMSYSAPAGCPTEAQMVSMVEQLGGRFSPAPEGALARRFEVLIARTEAATESYSGTLAILPVGGGARVRSVTCGHCRTVAYALALVMAMALADGPPASADATTEASSDAAEPSSPGRTRPVDAPRLDPPAIAPADGSGGFALLGEWNGTQWGPSGASLFAVTPGGTHLGAVATLTQESLSATPTSSGSAPRYGQGQGVALRLGAVAAWGAPWSLDETWGFSVQAGLRASQIQGTTWDASDSAVCGAFGGTLCSDAAMKTPTTWRTLVPYVAASIFLQVAPKAVVRPLFGLTVAGSSDDLGLEPAGYVTLDAGLAWRAW